MAQSAVSRIYQDFEPFFEWSEDETSATLVITLPGFAKEQLRVQVTSTPVLRINGERRVFENIWRRFAKEFSIPPYCDTNEVSAKFDGGILSIKFPKLITPVKPLPQEAPMPQRPSAEPEAQARDQDQESQQKDLKEPTSDEKEKNRTQEAPEKEKEKEKETISDEKEKNNKREEMAPKDVAQENVRTNNEKSETETAQVTSPKAIQDKPKAKLTQRLKTRVLDFSVSLRSGEDEGVKQRFGDKIAKVIKRPKIWLNIFVAILLVMVLALYVKNAIWPSQGGSKFEEF